MGKYPQDIGGGPEPLLAEESQIHDIYLADLQAAVEQAVSAERLGFSWRLDSYMCPVGEVDSGMEQREYRLVVYRHLLCPRLPMSYESERPGVPDSAEATDGV